jgi:hypothetical protein
MPLEIRRQSVGRFVTTRAILLQPTAISGLGVCASIVRRVLGLCGSAVRIIRAIPSNPASRSDLGSSGRVPVSNSYRTTPSEKISVRVSTSNPLVCACSGDMYSGVPISAPVCVKSVCCVNDWFVALAMPKSITFGTGFPSTSVTRMFVGFRSRWMIPF